MHKGAGPPPRSKANSPPHTSPTTRPDGTLGNPRVRLGEEADSEKGHGGKKGRCQGILMACDHIGGRKLHSKTTHIEREQTLSWKLVLLIQGARHREWQRSIKNTVKQMQLLYLFILVIGGGIGHAGESVV